MFATILKIFFIIHHLVPRLGLGVEATIRPEPRNINHAAVRVFYVRAVYIIIYVCEHLNVI